jgi:hypothetical protein
MGTHSLVGLVMASMGKSGVGVKEGRVEVRIGDGEVYPSRRPRCS